MAEAQAGKLTRQQMEEIVRRGEGVIYAGQVHTSVDTLPAEEELAGDDQARKARIADDIDAEITALSARRDRIRADAQAQPLAGAKAAKASGPKDTGSAAPAGVQGSTGDATQSPPPPGTSGSGDTPGATTTVKG